MIFLPRFEAKLVLAMMERASVLMGVPTFYVRLLNEAGLTRDAVRHMRLFVSGSAPLLAETHRAFQERTGHAILERYGMTETNMNSSNPYDGPRIAGTVGVPLPGTELRVVDPDSGQALPAGSIGMIEVRGPNVFRGYWRMPEKTASEFREGGFFVTGDLGLIDEQGHVQIVGRGKDLVITGGYNVYPKEVEAELDRLDGVIESAVIGVPHPDLGEGVVAVLAVSPDHRLSEAEVQAALAARLARYKLPKRVLFVDELPRNAMSKVQKNILRERHAAAFAD
jgi:malonyl-CoA/methylmalonyl-CoA synthetase